MLPRCAGSATSCKSGWKQRFHGVNSPFTLQAKEKKLQTELQTALSPGGRARQVKPDSDFLQRQALWHAYRVCSDRAQIRAGQRRAGSFRHLKLPDGRAVHFTREARRELDPSILARIRSVLRGCIASRC